MQEIKIRLNDDNLSDVTDTKKKRRGKKTPMEFEKRLIAGTKRYYMTKLEKMKSKIIIDSNQMYVLIYNSILIYSKTSIQCLNGVLDVN